MGLAGAYHIAQAGARAGQEESNTMSTPKFPLPKINRVRLSDRMKKKRPTKPFRIWRTGPAGPLLPFPQCRHDDRFLAVPLDPASLAAMRERVAKAMAKDQGWRKSFGPFSTEYHAQATAALSALHPAMGKKEKK
jgi:hypothetical protein